jgi:hypothetical protein
MAHKTKKCKECGDTINLENARSRARHGLSGIGHLTIFDVAANKHIPAKEQYYS